ncbi:MULTISPECIES: hypothetical protein [Bacillaceae]|uniref:Prenylated flavin chaperone LpdD-like domain-containing protein n=1 Tax=Evansella alkalicola TaxID=745819 RepID=A0ABS6JTC5_9BACI|nr:MULTISPECIES: hypothetical protein [Bacillaceae]MBU9721817.1 hypothetical protein [Bacillus alkalicola]
MIQCEVQQIGADDLIVITGGTRPHIGAVVIATWNNDQVQLVSHGLPHHKEEQLFLELATVWCNTFHKNVVVSGGIHVDNATKEEINNLVNKTWEKFFILMSDQKLKTIS